jgi:hypothetical protein
MLRRRNPELHELCWACMVNPGKLEECFKQMDLKAFYQLGKGVERCLWVRRKLKKIPQDYDQQNKRYKALYFEDWESFTRQELDEFCKDRTLNLDIMNMHEQKQRSRMGKRGRRKKSTQKNRGPKWR